MSYPWFKFRVTYVDGTFHEHIATGLDILDAMHELTDYENPVREQVRAKNIDVLSIEFIGMAEGYEWCLPSDWKDRLVPAEGMGTP